MANYDTFNPEIDNGYEPDNSRTYSSIDTDTPSRGGHKPSGGTPQRRGKKPTGGNKSRRRSAKTTPSLTIKQRIDMFLHDGRVRAEIGRAHV